MPDTALPPARSLPAGRCLDWLAAGWQLFLRDPARWMAVAALSLVILAALGVVPLIGWAFTLLAIPILGAGLVSITDQAARDGRVRIDALFDGLRRDAGKHVIIGVSHLAGALIIGFVAALIGTSAALTGALIGPLAAVGLATGGIMLAIVVFTALWIALIMALWFAPSLVHFAHADPVDALTHSAAACTRNLPAFAVLALALYVLGWIAMLPAGLGLLVLLPVLAGAQHAAYLDTFSAPATPAPGSPND